LPDEVQTHGDGGRCAHHENSEARWREMNNWDIPDWLEKEVKDRDRKCVYCGTAFESSMKTRKSMATWEHIVNDARIINRENIARCCFSCNASKGTKKLSDWLESDYCRKRGITKDTVAEVVKKTLVSNPSIPDDGA
jgi:5-methylcytosine-specific restriction endonuclease McrA